MAKSFDKFINKPVKGAKVKEAIRQEKKAAVRERREAIEKHFEAKRQQKQAAYDARQQAGDSTPRNSKPEYSKKSSSKDKGPRARSGGSKVGKKWDAPSKSKGGAEPKPFKKEGASDASRSRTKSTGSPKPFDRNNEQAPKRTYSKAAPARKTFYDSAKPKRFEKPNDKPAFKKPVQVIKKTAIAKGTEEARPASAPLRTERKPTERPAPQDKKPYTASSAAPKFERKPIAAKRGEAKSSTPSKLTDTVKKNPSEESMPLNKFLAHAGICSRRDAADKVRQGLASVNDQVITEPAFKVSDTDVVKFDGKKIHRSNNLVYVLLNKPKDTITTSEDPQGRKTVMDIIRPATQERVYPVGRLDRNTSGVLLLTNDGDLAQQLSHPSYEVRKIYEVRLDKALTKTDFDKILDGVTLEDGEIHADSLAYSDAKDKTMVGIEIHSGRNRIVRRLFEHLGYDVRGLDRVMYANLTKKNVERGHWRLLSEKEVRLLKYFNKSKKNTPKPLPKDFEL